MVASGRPVSGFQTATAWGASGKARYLLSGEKTAKLQKFDGYFPMYWDSVAGTRCTRCTPLSYFSRE